MNAHVYIMLLIGAKFTELCPQNDKSTCFNILFHTQYLTQALQAMHTAPDITYLVCKTSTLKEYLSLLPLPGGTNNSTA